MGNVHEQIDSGLNLWNKGAYKNLVQDSHRVVEEALGRKRGTQIQEHFHRSFQTLF